MNSAKITTLGERVEDTFLVQTADGSPIEDEEAKYTIQNAIRQRIDRALGVN